MIKRIFIDIDETMIFTNVRDPEQEHIKFTLKGDPTTYYTIVRPSAKDLIDFSRDLVGFDNVYLLTVATNDYAKNINKLAEWSFKKKNIIARKVVYAHANNSSMWGGGGASKHELSDKNNVLIDNLPPSGNPTKMEMMGIKPENYFQVRDYYGVNNNEKKFLDDVKAFLLDRHNNDNK